MEQNFPDVYRKMCRNLQPPMLEFVKNAQDVVDYALIGLTESERKELAVYVGERLMTLTTEDELLAFWRNSPSSINIENGTGVRAFLVLVQAAG